MDGMPNSGLSRRALMRAAILLVGGAAAGVPELAFAQTAAFFTADERKLLDAVCDTMIPKTDTPGAIDVGVPKFIDSMMTNWASDRTRQNFRAVLTTIDQYALESGGKPFVALSPTERTTALTAFDAAQFVERRGPYPRFKELVLTGYYLSEIGATQELRYELAPGDWEPSIPVTPDTRAWAV